MRVQFANAGDVWQWALAHGFPPPRSIYRCLLVQVGLSEAFTLRDEPDGVPLIIAGVASLAPSEGEVFFLGPPAGRGGLQGRLVTVVRLARPWLAQLAARYPGGLVVRVNTPEGRRLARVLGFVTDTVQDCADSERWVLR